MAAPTYRILTFDSDGSIYPSEDTFDTETDALSYVAASDWLHRLGDWQIETCDCGWGRIYTKGDVQRGVHIEPYFPEAEAAVEALAIALGLLDGSLTPASHRDGLVGMVI